ncbi:hypothetical protein GCM10027612_38560 [Microbispora bryophytorum subsp. camponoti]
MRADGAELALEGRRRHLGQIPHGADAEPYEGLLGALSHPHRAATGSGCRNSTTRSAGTTSRPSGLHSREASLATNFVLATPTEQVMPCRSATWARIIRAMAAGLPSLRRAPPTSRNASSEAIGSTSGVTALKISMTPRDTSAYMAWRGGMTVACGQMRRARVIGIAEWTPNLRAS